MKIVFFPLKITISSVLTRIIVNIYLRRTIRSSKYADKRIADIYSMYLYREKWSQKLFKLLDIPWIFTWLLQVVFNTIHAHSLFRAYSVQWCIFLFNGDFDLAFFVPRILFIAAIFHSRFYNIPGFVQRADFSKLFIIWNSVDILFTSTVAPRAIWMKSTLLNQLNVSKWPGQQRLNASPFKLFPGFKQRVKAMLLANEFVWLFHEFSRESFRLYRARGGLDQRSAVFIIGKRCENFLFNLRPNFVSKSNL